MRSIIEVEGVQVMKKNLRLLLILAITLIGCELNRPNSSQTKSSPASKKPETAQQSSPIPDKTNLPIPDRLLISEQGIGSAQLGMSLQQLKQTLGSEAKFEQVSPFIVDFDAIAVYQLAKVQYYIIYPSGTTFSDSDVIELLLTDNPQYRTAEGGGVGTTLPQAEAIYGEAILSHNTQAESREMVRFTNYSSQNIIFRPVVASESFAGIYPSSSAEYNETKKFHDSATIRSILVSR